MKKFSIIKSCDKYFPQVVFKIFCLFAQRNSCLIKVKVSRNNGKYVVGNGLNKGAELALFFIISCLQTKVNEPQVNNLGVN